MKRFITAMLCVVMALCMFGCGQSNEEKYTTLKNEVQVAVKVLKKDIQKDLKKHFCEENIPVYERNIKKAYEQKRDIDAKLKEMEALSKKELKLSNDLTEFKELVNAECKIINRCEARLNETKRMFKVK